MFPLVKPWALANQGSPHIAEMMANQGNPGVMANQGRHGVMANQGCPHSAERRIHNKNIHSQMFSITHYSSHVKFLTRLFHNFETSYK